MLKDTTIGFIGAGNMAGALMKGLVGNGVSGERIVAADPNPDKLQSLKVECGIVPCEDNAAVVAASDVVVLAVKPQALEAVLRPLGAALQNKHCLLVSVAAGIPLESLRAWTHETQAVVRCMPNTPALVGCGASALIGNEAVRSDQQTLAASIMEAVGSVVWLDEEAQMDAVTALSGSGPAYFFLLMEAMEQAAGKLGLSPELASALCRQTALGASRLAADSDEDVGELRRRVTSPGGTTEAALNQFLEEDFMALVERALTRAAQRSAELAGTQDS